MGLFEYYDCHDYHGHKLYTINITIQFSSFDVKFFPADGNYLAQRNNFPLSGDENRLCLVVHVEHKCPMASEHRIM